MTTREQLIRAKSLAAAAAALDGAERNAALEAMAGALQANTEAILAANREDVAASAAALGPVMVDRLTLTAARIAAMAEGIRQVAALHDPLEGTLSGETRPNGLLVEKRPCPMGVIAIIYESRPNVTADAAALCLKAGSAAVLRCGREAHRSCAAIVRAMQSALASLGLPAELVQLVEDTSRESARELMEAEGLVDLLIPRGGAGLIRACVEQAKVPCIQTGTGICHVYVDESADLDMALKIVENAKTSRPSVCNAEEVLLVHSAAAAAFLPRLKEALVDRRRDAGVQPVELRLCPRAAKLIPGTPAGSGDFDTEFLDYILAVKVVDSTKEAVAHIAAHSTHHSEAIVTRSAADADYFCRAVDSAAVYVNASTRFTDGGEFGMGCEMGISTQKLHARGPMGLRELCSYKYVVTGSGQIR